MENILNQTATNSNSNYMDHLYCHTNESSKNYVRNNQNENNKNTATKAIAINADETSEGMLQEEVISLKSMLLFHFDLIQTQAEQLQSKEIELKAQRAECEKLRVRNTQLSGQVAEIQQQLEEQMKRNVVIQRSSLPPPPLAKIQCLNENLNNKGQKNSTTTTTLSNSVATSIPTIANTTLADKMRMPKLATVVVNVKKLASNEIKANVNSNSTCVKNMPTIKQLTTPLSLVVKEDESQTINAKLKTNNLLNNTMMREKKETINIEKCNQVNNNNNNKEEEVDERNNKNELAEVEEKTSNNKMIENEVKEEISTVNNNNMKRSSSTLSIKAGTTASLSSILSSTSCSSPASSTTLQGLSKRRRVWQAPELTTDDSVNSFDSTLDIQSVSFQQYSVLWHTVPTVI